MNKKIEAIEQRLWSSFQNKYTLIDYALVYSYFYIFLALIPDGTFIHP
jgi:hypothetical protein